MTFKHLWSGFLEGCVQTQHWKVSSDIYIMRLDKVPGRLKWTRRDPRTEIITPSGRWEDEGPPREMTLRRSHQKVQRENRKRSKPEVW